MKLWKCPSCKDICMFDGDLAMKICVRCQEEMEVVEE